MPANNAHHGLLAPLETVMREAGALAQKTSRRPFERWTKGPDHSPVCEADIAVNDLLRVRLRVLAPDAGWLSEESEDDPAARTAPLLWVVDPIDGTRAFLAGFPDWTISVALVEADRPVISALYAPVTDEMFIAAHGRGTTVNGAPIAVSPGASLAAARLAGPKRRLDRIAKYESTVVLEPKIHSLALRIARVAQGRLEVAFAGGNANDWDLAAADLLLHEAGGSLTDLTGNSPRYNRGDLKHGALIAAGAARHAALLELVRDRLAEFA